MGRQRRKLHKIVLRDGRKMRYLIDCYGRPAAEQHINLELERDPHKIKASGLPVVFALHGMYLSGKSLLQNNEQHNHKHNDNNNNNDNDDDGEHVTNNNTTTPTIDTDNYTYIVIAVNRAGYHGSSNIQLGLYTYRDFALDIKEIADSLDIQKFGVMGHSSGGPNTLACAALLGPDRVTSFALMGSDPEYDHYDDIGNGDDDCMMDCCIGVWLPRTLRIIMPCMQVANGMRNDYILERKKYPFDCESICQPGVVIAGENDKLVPIEFTKRINNRLPNSELKIVPGIGHNQLLLDEVLDMAFRTVIELGQLRQSLPSTSNNNNSSALSLPTSSLTKIDDDDGDEQEKQKQKNDCHKQDSTASNESSAILVAASLSTVPIPNLKSSDRVKGKDGAIFIQKAITSINKPNYKYDEAEC